MDERAGDGAVAEDDEVGGGHEGLHVDVEAALRGAAVAFVDHAVADLAGLDAFGGEAVVGAERHEDGFVALDGLLRGAADGAAGAAAADPAFEDLAFGRDDGLGAGLGRGRVPCAHDRSERVRRAVGAEAALGFVKRFKAERGELHIRSSSWAMSAMAVERVGGAEGVEVGEGFGHAAGDGFVIGPALERVEPDDAAAAAAEGGQRLADAGAVFGVVAVREDEDDGAGVDEAAGVGVGEAGEVAADAGAAAEAFRQEGEAVQRAHRVGVAHGFRDADEAGVEEVGVGRGVAPHQAHEEGEEGAGVGDHGARDVAERRDLHGAVGAGAAVEVQGLAARGEAAADGAAEVDLRALARRAAAAGAAVAQGAAERLRRRVRPRRCPRG